MEDFATVSAVIAVLVGLGGMILAMLRFGPDKTNVVVTYQATVLDDLREENERLSRINATLSKRVAELEVEIEEQKAARHKVEMRLQHLEEIGARFEKQERENHSPE